MSDTAQTPAEQSQPGSDKPRTAQKSPRSSAVIGAVGVLLTVSAVGLLLMKSGLGISTDDPARPTLSFVDQRDLGAAAGTLTPSAAGALIQDAQRCRIPLVSMTLERGSAAVGSTLRIRSGSYVSPSFTITDGIQRLAVPYPAPYGAGAGSIVIEGNASGAVLGLSPRKVMTDLPGTQSIPVVWRAVNPC